MEKIDTYIKLKKYSKGIDRYNLIAYNLKYKN